MSFMPVIKLLLPLLLLAGASGCYPDAAGQRYRGDYTLGHEVNTFCPAINSQCYWIGPHTSQAVRDQLGEIYERRSPGLYKPVCLVISGQIDRDSPRPGFAADTDGLITVTRVYGDCASSETVTHGDLQHHRWQMTALDSTAVDAADWPLMPVLDFGERLFVEGSDGCRQFSGFAELSGDRIVFNDFDFGPNRCQDGRAPQGLFSITGAWEIRIEDAQYLILGKSETLLKFKLNDWR